MIIDVVMWLPSKVARCLLEPVTSMLETLAENADAAVAQYAEEHGL